MICVLDSNTPV